MINDKWVFINPQSKIAKPEDLVGKRIGCPTMQPASNVWINGILQDRHGVPHREQTWVVERDEDATFKPPPWLKVERVPRGTSAVSMLLNGELPAVMTPQTPKPLLDGDKRIARMFPDYVARERAYFKETGIFPIMHVTAIKQEIVDRYPWVPAMLCRAFEEAKQFAYQRMANVRVVPLPWFAAHWEDERALFGPDPWVYGLGEANRHTRSPRWACAASGHAAAPPSSVTKSRRLNSNCNALLTVPGAAYPMGAGASAGLGALLIATIRAGARCRIMWNWRDRTPSCP